MFSFKNEIGRFSGAKVKLIENGPVKGTLRVESRYNNSLLIQDFTYIEN